MWVTGLRPREPPSPKLASVLGTPRGADQSARRSGVCRRSPTNELTKARGERRPPTQKGRPSRTAEAFRNDRPQKASARSGSEVRQHLVECRERDVEFVT